MSTNRRRVVKKKKIAMTSTQRSQRRRFLMKQNCKSETRIETGFVEKELLKRTADASGYNSVAEYVISKAIEHGAEYGITPASIQAETKLIGQRKEVKQQE